MIIAHNASKVNEIWFSEKTKYSAFEAEYFFLCCQNIFSKFKNPVKYGVFDVLVLFPLALGFFPTVTFRLVLG